MKYYRWLLLSFFVIILDQYLKQWAVSSLSLYQPIAITSWLNWTLAFNTGAAFSFLSKAGDWHNYFFILFTLVMVVILSIWFFKLKQESLCQAIGLSLIIGGALGNLCDRLLRGHVVDFIDFHYQNWHWPIFNGADIAICTGALFLMIGFSQEK